MLDKLALATALFVGLSVVALVLLPVVVALAGLCQGLEWIQ